jgi:CheY-like chemotaxis protein
MTRILIVDDDDAFRESLAETLTDLGHETIEASNGHDALRIFATDAPLDCAFLDFRMTDMSGIDVLERLREMPSRSTLPVVVLTAFATSDNTIHAMRLGAFEHLTKPVGRDAIAALLANIDESSEPDPRGDAPRIEEDSGEPRLIGASDALREVQKQIGRAAASDSTVLITGETGTGKEVAARVLHDASKRHGGPFVAINCAAIPAELLESELFGHTKGAFTGAVAERAGRFVEARGGTLFLDEIGDMPLSMQAKLLRAIQERAVMPLGANRPVDIDVRIVAATHRDLQAEVVARTFREAAARPAGRYPAARAAFSRVGGFSRKRGTHAECGRRTAASGPHVARQRSRIEERDGARAGACARCACDGRRPRFSRCVGGTGASGRVARCASGLAAARGRRTTRTRSDRASACRFVGQSRGSSAQTRYQPAVALYETRGLRIGLKGVHLPDTRCQEDGHLHLSRRPLRPVAQGSRTWHVTCPCHRTLTADTSSKPCMQPSLSSGAPSGWR